VPGGSLDKLGTRDFPPEAGPPHRIIMRGGEPLSSARKGNFPPENGGMRLTFLKCEAQNLYYKIEKRFDL